MEAEAGSERSWKGRKARNMPDFSFEKPEAQATQAVPGQVSVRSK